MSVAKNTITARRFYEEFLDKFDIAGLDTICAKNMIHHDNATARDLETYKRAQAAGKPVFPDSHFTVEDAIAAGDKVTLRWTWRGTQTGEWAGIAPTGKPTSCPGISIFRFEGDKIAEVWGCWDSYLLRKG
jgi:steroid delta-isomerase-like uncharacterized protein